MILTLAKHNLTARKARLMLTLSAVALSVALVVSTTSGYASLKAAVYGFIARFVGSFDARVDVVTRGAGVPESLVARLAADPDVRRAVPRVETDRMLLGPGSTVADPRPFFIVGLDPNLDDAPVQLDTHDGTWFRSASARELVVDQAAAERLGAKVGDVVRLPTSDGPLELTVVGVIAKPGIFAAFIQTAYMPIDLLQRVSFGDLPNVSQINVEFQTGVDAEAFVSRWQAQLGSEVRGVRVQSTRKTREQLDRQLSAMDIMSYMGGTATMLAATFIVFSTLAMGVTERQRTLAMLRAVGAVKRQIAMLVVFEGLMIAGLGVIVGVPLGLGFVQMLAWFFPQFFANGVVISWGGVLFAGGVSLLAALAASVLPAINAMRVDPLEAMSAVAKVRRGRAPWGWALVGVGLMSIDPLVTFVPWDRIAASAGLETLASYHRDIRFYLHFILGIPGVLIGAFLIAPLAVWSIDRWIAPIVARLIGLKPQLLQQQLGGAMWRAAGTGAALMVGLGVLIVMQTQGRSGMGAWQLPTKFPDAFVWSATGGIDDRALDKLGALPGVIGGRDAIMPIGVFSPEYADSMFGLAGLAFMPNATTFIAVDPDRVFDLMGLEFRQGDPASAQAMLKKGRHLLVTEELSRVRNLGIGDSLGLKRSDGSVIEYTIAGVVWSPGIDVMVAAFDMRRQFDQRTAASVFGTIDDARRDFNKTSFELAAVNIEDGVSKQELLSNLQAEMSRVGLAVADVRRLKGDILTRVNQLLMLGSTVAWCAMLVATLGVTNTVMAGIRVRQWQFGVLRSIGATRGTLLRLVLAESVLLGAIGVVMGLTTGLVMSLDAWKFYDIIIGFRPPLIIPWDAIAAGIVVVLAGSVIATIIPAIRAARADVLSMLQAGRASS